MKTNLKPCPFCGSKAQIIKIDQKYFGAGITYFGSCKNCYARTLGVETEKRAIDLWNQRVGEGNEKRHN